jgi:myo-inositol 2-dehydrogenase/D-chiro-inositol 1-dehydrogenase
MTNNNARAAADTTGTQVEAAAAADVSTRRGFLGAGATASLAAGLMVHSSVEAAEETRDLRLAVVGCGGRGGGAINDSLTINKYVTFVAAADLYVTKCASLRQAMSKAHEGKVKIDDANMYGGLDGYKRVLDDPTVDVVLLTTSPGFRPRQIRDAVEAGKHVFAEKPSCVDPAGYRICLEADALARAKGTAIVTGTQYRRQTNYVGAVEQIRAGAIGRIIGGTARYCSSGIWYRPRSPGMSDAEYQLNNWYHFVWLSGDQIVEQAVHNIDTINWVMGANPVSAFGSGGRFTRPEDSELWDSMSIDYEYPDGRFVSFKCRQIPGTAGDVGNVILGADGVCHIGASNAGSRIVDHAGKTVWEMKGSIADAYKQEHKDLIDSILGGRPIVELKQTADSSMAAVLGRVAAYTGQKVSWEFLARDSKLDLFPPNLAWDASLPKPQHAVPGKTKLV